MTFFSRQQWNTWESVVWILSAIPAEPILGYKYSSDKETNIRCRELLWRGLRGREKTPGYLAISFTQSWIKCVTSKRRGANIVISWLNRPPHYLDLTSWKWYISSYSICFSSCAADWSVSSSLISVQQQSNSTSFIRRLLTNDLNYEFYIHLIYEASISDTRHINMKN